MWFAKFFSEIGINFDFGELPWDLFGLEWGGLGIWVLLIAARALINIVFSAGVYVAAKDRKMVLAPRIIWTLATLFGGVFIAVAYWVVHHSGLSGNNISKGNIYQ